jgi:hypothetical protein
MRERDEEKKRERERRKEEKEKKKGNPYAPYVHTFFVQEAPQA